LKKCARALTDIEKKAGATCLGFAISNTVKNSSITLLENGYVERISGGAHRITEKGERLLEILGQKHLSRLIDLYREYMIMLSEITYEFM